MKNLYTVLLLSFFYFSGYGQSCSDIVVTIEEAAATGETFQIGFGNYAGTGVLYEVYLDGSWYDQFFDPDGTFDLYTSISTPGDHEYEIKPWVNGLGLCYSKWLNINIVQSITENYTVRLNSPLRTSDGQIFFVNSSNELCVSTESGGSWYDVPLNYNAPDVLNGTRFTAETDYGAFYIGTDHKMYQMIYNGGWAYSVTISSMYAHGNTDLEYHDGKVFYLDNNRKMCAIAGLGGTKYNMMLNSNAPVAKDGPGFTTERWYDGGSHIFYISSSNQLIELNWTSSTGWVYYTRTSNVGIRSDSDLKFLNSNTSLVWIGTNNRIMGTFGNPSSGYYNFILNNSAPTVKSGSEFYVNTSNDNIYYIGSDNKIYKMYWTSSTGWTYTEATDRQMEAKGGITLSNGDLFFTRSDDNKIYYYDSNDLKSATIKNGNTVVDSEIEVYPNPTMGRTYIRLSKDMEVKTANIDVFDVFGKLVLHKKDFESGYIDISNSLNGTYFMKIQFGDRIETHKIILQK